MNLPFSTEQFLEVFRDYNTAIWPAQIAAYLLGLVAVAVVALRRGKSGWIVGGILAAFWIWTGIVYHLMFFAQINEAAAVFGGLFVLQGAFFLFAGVLKPRLSFSMRLDGYGIAGAVLVTYALFVYPVIGYLLGHGYPFSPAFGVAPCPTAIFTFGILLWTRGRIRWWILVIPLLWSLVGFSAVVKLGILEDAGLIVAGVVSTSMLLYRNRHTTRELSMA